MADDTSGVLRIDAVSGEVIARFHSGVLTAKNISGEVTASGIRHPDECPGEHGQR